MSAPRAAYVHVPFCRHRCGYCNFTVVADRDDLIDGYLEALRRELQLLESPRPVDTIFLGGGTPTHLSCAELERLLHLVTYWFPLAAGGEFSVEANPCDVNPDRVAMLADAGVNRISLGAQAWNAAKLKLLERDHDPQAIERAVEQARMRIPHVSLDLIFGSPGETLADWHHDLQRSLSLAPQHISTYGLTYEKGAMFWNRVQRHELEPVSEELERAMYELAMDTLVAAGMEHYEVSNFALRGHRCRHNEVYWKGESYYAAGPGAARYVDGWREMNHRSTTTWMRRVMRGESPVAERELLVGVDRARERLVFGLRRLEGIDLEAFAAATGWTVQQLTEPKLTAWCELGLMQRDSQRLRLTREGLMLSDTLCGEILALR
jgi:oxygen-independent coproporphyrinogen-3 oxidase